MKTKVVNYKKEKYDIYIGTGKCPKTGKLSKWANPYTFCPNENTPTQFVCADRRETIEKYIVWFFKNINLVQTARKELRGRILGSNCKPEMCHGDFLAQFVENKGRTW